MNLRINKNIFQFALFLFEEMLYYCISWINNAGGIVPQPKFRQKIHKGEGA